MLPLTQNTSTTMKKQATKSYLPGVPKIYQRSLLDRRVWTIVLYTSTLSWCIAYFAKMQVLPAVYGVWLLGSLMLTGLALWRLFWRTGLYDAGHQQDTALDERQRYVRDRAYRWSYSFVALLLIMQMFYTAVALDKNLWLPDSYEQANVLFWALFLLVMTLPPCLLAWTEPQITEE
jgi:hypothetical protein